MNIKIIKEPMSNYQDIHGGECALMTLEINVDANIPIRVQRNLVIHAIIESFCRNWEHDKVEELTEYIVDALDEIE